MKRQDHSRSEALFAEACKYIPGGVNSPVRAFKSVGMSPIYIDHGIGGHLIDVDGNEYIDVVSSWGPHILGHAHPEIISAVQETAKKGTSFGACIPMEVEMAKTIQDFFPTMEMVRMVNSGTEATMSAVRLARGYTERPLIIKFDGCYHGHSDAFLVQAGSGVQTFSSVQNNGVTQSAVSETLIAHFNDLTSVEQLFEEHPGQIACVILEPVMGNMGVILPEEGFLEGLRRITEREGALLIFDEVITGFRLSRGGAQEHYKIRPDLTCLGKIIGGGLPVGAFGGKREIMEHLSPQGAVYQAGTLSGNPLALSAGLAMLHLLAKPETYPQLQQNSDYFAKGVKALIEPYKEQVTYNVSGSLSTLFFNKAEVKDAQSSRRSDTELYARYFRGMLAEGIYIAPSQFEATFVSAAHTKSDLARTHEAMQKVLSTLFAE
ncbi:MAG: glutamate-1-semialdehyde 2,1-aminomutase [Porphyromonas sp.]|nr:glutamate-1-semialdehyde 2,1-aminomutase [Porphyromonas sp.]